MPSTGVRSDYLVAFMAQSQHSQVAAPVGATVKILPGEPHLKQASDKVRPE